MIPTNCISHFLCVVGSVLFVAGLAGCGETYEPKPLTAEEEELKQQYSPFKDALSRAMGQAGDYVQVAVVDRSTTLPEDEREHTRMKRGISVMS